MSANSWPPFLRGRLLAILTLAYVAGLGLGSLLHLPLLLGGGLALVCFGAALALGPGKRLALPLLLLAMTALGCFMYDRAELAVSSFPVPAKEEARILGRARTDSVQGEGRRQQVLLAVETVNGRPWRGLVYVYYEGEPLLRGSMVGARGQVMTFTPQGNPGAFDYGAYLRRQGIGAAISCYNDGELRAAAASGSNRSNVRTRLLTAFEEAAGERASLLRGVFLGDKGNLSFEQKSALTYSGMMHAFSVSGMHVGYLVAAAMMLAGAGRRRRWARLSLVGLMLLFYLSLTGMPAPVMRAALMAVCFLLAGALDERAEPYTTLSLAALLCLLYRPLWLMDAGFQLSFAAAYGLCYLMRPMSRLLGWRRYQSKGAAFLRDAIAVTLAASFATMPLISYYYYNISLVGWILSIPFMLGTGLAVICCFAASLGAIFSSTLAQLPVYMADVTMRLLYTLSDYGSALPGAYISSGHTPIWAVICFYLLLAALAFILPRIRRRRLVWGGGLFCLMLLLSFSPSLTQALSRPAGQQLEVVFLDVGQGDAALILTPGGKTLLVDGGGSRLSPGSVGENVLIPYLRYRGLRGVDVLVSTHPDEDHIDGLLSVLRYMRVGQVLYGDVFPESQVHEEMLALAKENGALLTPVYAGQRFAVEEGLILEIYHPPQGASYDEGSSNDGSLTMALTYGEISFLFTGDVIFEAMEEIPAAQIVKLPHHGSKSNYDEEAYEKLEAEAVILSAGRDNSYGHPAPIVVEYWQERAYIYRTDTQGAITIFSDGHSWQGRTYWPVGP